LSLLLSALVETALSQTTFTKIEVEVDASSLIHRVVRRMETQAAPKQRKGGNSPSPPGCLDRM